ncbi:hypothetical protein GGX14DRAFT_699906 [Mycena pura]|uniref:WSC domain-containing protein n=1 Tax=Mycena pura TaxID=153505 RepID=A0AAD6Y4J6_9AGAR|nr:hypothetical protein GGX14DRAFT_699906 [Mycena pura]
MCLSDQVTVCLSVVQPSKTAAQSPYKKSANDPNIFAFAMFFRAALIVLAFNHFASSAAQTTLPAYKTWTSIGCQRDSVQGRVLHHLVTLSNATVEACLDACIVDNYALAGLEFGHECYCGNSVLYDYPQPPECILPCAGDSAEICGGPESLSLYQNADIPFTVGNGSVVQSYGLWQLWGCVEENGRLLAHGPNVPIPSEQLTVERCADGCAAAGWTTAGLERGSQCCIFRICGNISEPWPGGWESTSLSECNLPCLGNGQELCGGTLDDGRFLAYSDLPVVATAPPQWLQEGCFDDVPTNGGMHLLPHAPNTTIPSAEMTVEKCISACNNAAGYNASAGVTSGDECWCGDYSATPGVLDQSNSCNLRCTGDGREVCGGSGFMFIYSNPVVALQSYRTVFGNWSLQGCFVDDTSPCERRIFIAAHSFTVDPVRYTREKLYGQLLVVGLRQCRCGTGKRMLVRKHHVARRYGSNVRLQLTLYQFQGTFS